MAYTQSLTRTASWVIVNKETDQPVCETYSDKLVQALNTNKYKAVPILEWLQSINKQSNILGFVPRK
jgi:acyl-ACP thioesterase